MPQGGKRPLARGDELRYISSSPRECAATLVSSPHGASNVHRVRRRRSLVVIAFASAGGGRKNLGAAVARGEIRAFRDRERIVGATLGGPRRRAREFPSRRAHV